jgi:hypothetical protein
MHRKEPMKRNLTFLVEEQVVKLLRAKALESGRSIDNMAQAAIVAYLQDEVPAPTKREKAYRLFCERPIRLTRRQFKTILTKDA